ncbi:uncharacterized protein MKZ38_004804 [Zalerion maritima]|uniref:Uncharacterized protein n=1 Tax=Zalerion maritima TaxID=339359 RepID=A0AAD5RL64_9PEZI|nr:uncharacterized protein MKZ38_004804 [Zalerion maritima]
MMESRMESKGKKLLGKMFKNRDRKQSNDSADDQPPPRNNADLDGFFNSGDRLPAHPPPPPPPGGSGGLPNLKLNTTQVSRFQNSADLQTSKSQYQGTPIPRRNQGRKNLAVRFIEAHPEIIGEGGDESEIPTIDISHRKRTRGQSAPVVPPPSLNDIKGFPDGRAGGNFMGGGPPTMLRRTQTGFHESAPTVPPAVPSAIPRKHPGRSLSVRAPSMPSSSSSNNENRRSFIEIHQAEMREAEGEAFAKAARSASSGNEREQEETSDPIHITSHPPPPSAHPHSSHPQSSVSPNPLSSHPHEMPPQAPSPQPPIPPAHRAVAAARPSIDHSPASVHSMSSLSHTNSTRSGYMRGNGSPPSPTKRSTSPLLPRRTPTWGLHEVVSAAGADALDTFKSRVKHLFELFRLSAEAHRPLSSCTPEELCRGSLWWFLRGRMGVESAIRARPSSPDSQRSHEFAKQQAFTDLSKAYWMSEEMIPEVTGGRWTPTETELDGIRKSLLSNLRKLTMSMKRNEFMPPDEPFLPAAVDKTIWVEYPDIPQDLLALLSGSGGYSLRPTAPMDVLDTLPIGDTTQFFNFGRVSVNAYLVERDGDPNKRLHFPCFLSTVRPQKQPNLVFVLASQNGAVQLRIQGNKNLGPVWDDVAWRNENCALDIKLPRGFMLVVQCTQADYRMLFGMYDFGSKVQSTLYARPHEQVLFRSTLQGFQYFDADPQSRVFPKESVQTCEVGLFEKIHKENSPYGVRSYHRGYRVAVVTGPRTRTLSGVNHVYTPTHPVQFGFLRGENEDPALVLRFESSRSKGRMVFSFNDEKERFRFHNLLTGTALHHDEQVCFECPLTSYMIGQRITDNLGIQGFNHLNYKRARIVNDGNSGDEPPTVLSDRMRVIVDFENGTMTDRINVGPGEFRIRLDPRVPTALILFRHPQADLTLGIADSQASKEMAQELNAGLDEVQNNPTVRTLRFANVKDLHTFQASLTGFNVLFDGIASTFAIARRRMVVPIHKKWEAGETRIQLVEQDQQIQILAFFEDFSHGHCMNFVLKSTDLYENFSRSSKSGLRIVDAKFPLPRMTEEAGEEASFVCLDSPDYAGEHDDISILFEKDAGMLKPSTISSTGILGANMQTKDRDRLAQCLPAPVVKGSRLR